MKTRSLVIGLGIAASAMVTACGGGSDGGDDGPQNTIVRFDVMPSTKVTVMAGESVPLYAFAETFGPSVQAMSWVGTTATGSAKGSLAIEDSACALGSFSSREVPGNSKLKVGTGKCETVAKVPEDAEGDFIIVGSVTGSDASQRSEKVLVKVLPKPKISYDFTLATRADGDLALNTPIRLIAQPTFDNPIPDSAKMEYEWKLLFGPGVISGAPNLKENYIIMPLPGKYVYHVKAKLTNGKEVIEKTAVAVLSVDENTATSAIDFKVKAETAQSTVVAGSPANLVASYTTAPGAGVNKAEYKWSQLTGPEAALSSTDQKSIFVTPTSAGTYVFLVEVTITAGAIKETKSATVSVVATAAPNAPQ